MTAAHPRAKHAGLLHAHFPQAFGNFDPVHALLDAVERQGAAWEALPPELDPWREQIAGMSWSESEALLRQSRPTILTRVARALRHALDRLAEDNGSSPDDYLMPLARNAVTALEQMTGVQEKVRFSKG